MNTKIWNTIKIPFGVLGILAMGILGLATNYEDSDDFEVAKNLEIFSNVYKELNTHYVDEIDPKKLMESGMRAMLKSLDPYTVYISPEEVEQFESSITGKYGGLGTSIMYRDGNVVVTEPYEGSPADKAGLRAGDLLLSANGVNLTGKTSREVSLVLRGMPGTAVKLKVKRFGTDALLNKELNRAEIRVPNLPYYNILEEETAYIKLTTFSEHAGRNVSNALMNLKNKGSIKRIILDLRDNTGGLLNEAVNVINVFVPKGELVVQIKGKDKSRDQNFRTLNQPIDLEIPLTVLINKNSASASEIVAGAIQDLDRGIVLGQKSYGKGLVQNTRNISFGGKVKLTTARYYIPSGRCIQATNYKNGKPVEIVDSLRMVFKTRNNRPVYDGGGITPDVLVEDHRLANILKTLENQYLIFDYATSYVLKHETIETAEKFNLKDVDFDAFVTFLQEKNYSLTTQTEEKIKALEKKAEAEHYKQDIKENIKAIRKALEEAKAQELSKYKSEILLALQNEIVERYYFSRGGIINRLAWDAEVKKAIHSMEQAEYEPLLSVPK